MDTMDPLELPRGRHFLDESADAPLLIDGDLESALDVYQRNALLLQSQPQYLIFASSRSMERSLKYYNERSWSPANLDYSKLLRGCREKDVTYTLLTKASIEVLDLTDDVRIIGAHACGFGSFADVWKGIWYDRQKGEVKQNVVSNLFISPIGFIKRCMKVAIKMLRAHLNDYTHDKIFDVRMSCYSNHAKLSQHSLFLLEAQEGSEGVASAGSPTHRDLVRDHAVIFIVCYGIPLV